jgi:hypothetical protein
MVTVDVSQWVEPVTKEPVGVKTIFHDTVWLPLPVTMYVELVVVRVLSAAVVALVRVLVYVCPATASPVQSLLSCSVIVSVPLSGVPPVAATVPVSFGTQLWLLDDVVVSPTVKHSVVSSV